MHFPAILLFLAFPVLAFPAKRQGGLQVVDNCVNQGQVALTYDGEYFPSPSTFSIRTRRGAEIGRMLWKLADVQMDRIYTSTAWRTLLMQSEVGSHISSTYVSMSSYPHPRTPFVRL